MTKALRDILKQAESWPSDAQEELAQVAREIDASLKGEKYYASEDELRAIDEAREAVRRNGTVSSDEVAALLGKCRRRIGSS